MFTLVLKIPNEEYTEFYVYKTQVYDFCDNLSLSMNGSVK